MFANSTCYDEPLMDKIAHLACKLLCTLLLICYNAIIFYMTYLAGLRKGAFFISLTKRLPSSDFAVLEYEMTRMSWGDATIFIMQKITEPNEDADEDDDDDDDDNNEAKK